MGKWISRHRRSSYVRKSGGRDRRYDSARDHGDEMRQRHAGGPGFPRLAPCTQEGVTTALAVTEGRYLLSGNKDGVVLYQNLETGDILSKWHVHDREVTDVKIIGDTLLSSSRDKSVMIWKNGRDEEVGKLTGHTLSVSTIDCDANCNHVCSGSRDNSLIMWDVESQTSVRESKLSRNLVTDLCWSTELNIIAQTAEDKMVKLWDPQNLEVIHSFPPQGQIQTNCAIHNNFLLTSNNGFGGSGCEICLWDLRQQKLLQTFRGHTETVSCCRFLQDGRGFVSCSHDGTVRLWHPHGHDLSILESQQQLNLSLNSGTLTCLAVIDHDNIVCASFDSGLKPVRMKPRSHTL